MTEKPPSTRPVGVLLTACLAISVSLHVALFFLAAYVCLIPSPRISGYLEVSELVPAMAPHISAAAPSPARIHEPPEHTGMQQPPPIAADRVEVVPEPSTAYEAKTTPLGLGMTYGYVTSLADGVTLRDDIREYYALLVEKINRIWWEQAAQRGGTSYQDGIIEVVVQRDGTLIDRRIRKSTGSREVDRSMLATAEQAAPLPHLPATYELPVFMAPLRIKAPSHLFR